MKLTDRRLLALELGRAFTERLDLDDLIPFVIAKCRELLNAESAAVLLIDPERNEFYFPCAVDENPAVAARLQQTRFAADQGIAGAAAQSRKSLRVDDVSSDPRWFAGVDQITGRTTRSILAAPLTVQAHTIGVLEVVNRSDGFPFDDDDLAFLNALAAGVAVAIQNARRYGVLKSTEEKLRVQVAALRRDLARSDRFGDIVATSAAMREVLRLMDSAAASTIAVLIEGETGAGKELVARGIHRASERAERAFIAVNCAALPESLLESQLFGHRKGAFTGAMKDQIGFFEAADGGTIFLDEIGDMPPPMQARLLRVLQDGEVVPIGDTRPRAIDVRVLSATNRQLAGEVEGGRFRRDLYYRLAAFPIIVPPLRERREDIPLLIDHFLAIAAERHHKRIAGIEPAAVDQLIGSEWLGNVRELQSAIERAIALAQDGATIGVEQLPRPLAQMPKPATTDREPEVVPETTPRSDPADSAEASDLRRARAGFEATHVAKVLAEHHGNISRAAQALGLSRVALRKKIKEYGLR
jgi:Nif-specific regulatory protein